MASILPTHEGARPGNGLNVAWHREDDGIEQTPAVDQK